jgi:hypothetical protein
VLQVGLVVAPFARDVIGLEPLGAEHWLLIVGIAFGYLAVVEIDKAVHRSLRSRRLAPPVDAS